jgi:hypothetical protein
MLEIILIRVLGENNVTGKASTDGVIGSSSSIPSSGVTTGEFGTGELGTGGLENATRHANPSTG